MSTINIATQGQVFNVAVLETVLEHADATVHVVDVEGDRFAAIVYQDGTVITSSDWQSSFGHNDRETVLEAIANPARAHQWMRASDFANCIIVDGLPRVMLGSEE
ncbi:hypothetical protein [Roseibium aggregatum]|uniref:hypothetical protein n=1 Tax=Roseibium aggregatum TaxID=187304 RepID=UPI001E3D04B1|nr:hypothetical protein [Roseibium aggregatum]UES49922.1 hypothetical protein GFK88_10025 [Roseibium aggregatum]